MKLSLLCQQGLFKTSAKAMRFGLRNVFPMGLAMLTVLLFDLTLRFFGGDRKVLAESKSALDLSDFLAVTLTVMFLRGLDYLIRKGRCCISPEKRYADARQFSLNADVDIDIDIDIEKGHAEHLLNGPKQSSYGS